MMVKWHTYIYLYIKYHEIAQRGKKYNSFLIDILCIQCISYFSVVSITWTPEAFDLHDYILFHARFHIKFETTQWTPHISFPYTSFNSFFHQCRCVDRFTNLKSEHNNTKHAWRIEGLINNHRPPPTSPTLSSLIQISIMPYQMVLSVDTCSIKWLYCIDKG